MRLRETLTVLADLGDPDLFEVLAWGAVQNLAPIAAVWFRRAYLGGGRSWGGLCWVSRA